MASSSTSASLDNYYNVFINHRGPDTKKTLASHLYRRVKMSSDGLKAFLDQDELQVGDHFPSQIKDAIANASVHVAIFSPGYAESEWCLNELVLMLDSKAPIIPVFWHVQPNDLRRNGKYAKGLRNLENKKTQDAETNQEKPRYDSTTIRKWRDALFKVSEISGLDLQETCNGDEGKLVEMIVQLVLKKVKTPGLENSENDTHMLDRHRDVVQMDSENDVDNHHRDMGIISMAQKSKLSLRLWPEDDDDFLQQSNEFYCSELYGGPGGDCWNDGIYSGIRRIIMTEKNNSLTSVKLYYGKEGDESVKYMAGFRHGGADGAQIEYILNYPEEIVTKISGHIGRYGPWESLIVSLAFHTNQRTLGPCGQEKGTYFETQVGGKIVGVFGCASESLVDSIGVYFLKPRTSKNEEFYCSQRYGGPGGYCWNDGTYSGIRRITMTAKDNSLTSIKVHYGIEGDENVKDIHFPGLRHGGAIGAQIEYDLNYPEEFVTKISGYYGSSQAYVVIKSLTFHTNQRKLGPCGQERGTHFETEMGGKIVGLFGYASETLVDSIGVYMLNSRSSKEEVSESI